jgi:hypothetical protein
MVKGVEAQKPSQSSRSAAAMPPTRMGGYRDAHVDDAVAGDISRGDEDVVRDAFRHLDASLSNDGEDDEEDEEEILYPRYSIPLDLLFIGMIISYYIQTCRQQSSNASGGCRNGERAAATFCLGNTKSFPAQS